LASMNLFTLQWGDIEKQHKPGVKRLASIESTRNRKKTRRWRYTCRPNTGGQTPREVVSVGYLRVALVSGLFQWYMS